MTDTKSVLAQNIIKLRKSKNWTQTELAEKLNYSDKAISKWERAESIPDVTVLKQLASLFNVTVDYLLEETHDGCTDNKPSRHQQRNRLVVALLSVSLVFFIATVLFVVMGLTKPFIAPAWLVYIYAVPIACVVLLVFSSLWGRRFITLTIISVLVWSTLLSVYLSLDLQNIWLVFIAGIPAQVIILLWGWFKFK